MGNDALLENGEYDQMYNGEESPGPSNPQGDNTTEPLGRKENGSVVFNSMHEGTGYRNMPWR